MAAKNGTGTAEKNIIATPSAMAAGPRAGAAVSGGSTMKPAQTNMTILTAEEADPKTDTTITGPGMVAQVNGPDGNAMASGGDNAMASGSDNAMTSGSGSDGPPDGYSGIRSSLRDRGVEGMLGWNDATKSVTIGGVDAYKPQYNIDGTTYADEKTINNLTNRAYESTGDPLMGARAYMDSLGLAGSVQWDGTSGTVNIGGMAIKPTYVSDGIAYIPKSQLDAAAAAYRSRTGIHTPQGVFDSYESRYDRRIESALKSLQNAKYSYDPSNNPLYLRYAAEKQRQADDAYRQVLNDNSSSVYGASGAVLAEAMAAKNSYLDSIAADWERLDNTAYSRYKDDLDRQRDSLNDIITVGNNYYDKLYQADADSYTRTRAGAQDTNNAYQQQFENEQTAEANAAANALKYMQAGYTDEQTRGLDLENSMRQYDLDTYPDERRMYLEGLDATNRYNRARSIDTELANEKTRSYLGGGIVTDDMPNFAAVARALGYRTNGSGIYVDAYGKPFSSIDAERLYNAATYRDANNAKLGIYYSY